jgi:tetratricopeptide (TPR) repeat protein
MNLAATELNDGSYDEARHYLELLINDNTSAVFQSGESVLAKALFNYGLLEKQQGNLDAANAAWRRILEEMPDATDAHGASYASLARERLPH